MKDYLDSVNKKMNTSSEKGNVFQIDNFEVIYYPYKFTR